MTTIAKNLNQWLRDAHAAERQAETMLSTAAHRLEQYPELAARIRQHVEETKSQCRRLEQCLSRRGAGTSTMKDMAGQAMAMLDGMMKAMSGDEVVKTVLFSYAFEQMEIASYRILVVAAEADGDLDTRQTCEGILEEEIAMARWLEEHTEEITRAYLHRSQDGTTQTAAQ